MSNAELVFKMTDKAFCAVDEINGTLGDDYLYLTAACGFFRLYRKNGNRADRVVMAGRLDVDGLAHLLDRLDQAQGALA